MKLRDHLREGSYHSCLMTSFGIGFEAFEALALPSLDSVGCRNVAVLTDGRMLTKALGDPVGLPQRAGRDWSVAGAVSNALFHPKLWLQVGRGGGRLTIGSANLTIGGLSGNLELMTVLDSEDGDGVSALIAKACDFIEGLADPRDDTFAMQTEWMRARSPWLRGTTSAERTATLPDGTLAALLFSGEEEGIGTQFCELVEDGPVRQLIALSPYWDPALAALSYLRTRLEPEKTIVVIEDKGLFPGNLVSAQDSLHVHHHEEGNGRFVHAKALIARTDEHDHLLIGSANCTRAALGTADMTGSNVEACLYRRLPAKAAVEALGLAAVLKKRARMDPADLKEYDEGEDIPFKDYERRDPGRFMFDGSVLHWTPPASFDALPDQPLDLLDDTGTVLTTVRPDGAALIYPVDPASQTLAFARLADVQDAVPGIVIRSQMIRVRMRERRSGKLGDRLAELSDRTTVGLDLLDLLSMIEEADAAEDGDPGTRPARLRPTPDEPEEGRILDYDRFIAGRRAEPPGARDPANARDEVSIRWLLNRAIGMGETELPEGHPDLGDETGDAAAAIEDGESFDTSEPSPPPEPWSASEETARNRAVIVDAVERLCERLLEKGENGTLTPNDLLRLRIVLHIICASAWHGDDKSRDAGRSVLHVLPVESRDRSDWPSLVGRLLFILIGKPKPALRGLTLPEGVDALPSQVTECLLVALWTLQASLAAPVTAQTRKRTAGPLQHITTKAYALFGFSQEDLLSDAAVVLMRRMGESHAGAMGIDTTALIAAHEHSIRSTGK